MRMNSRAAGDMRRASGVARATCRRLWWLSCAKAMSSCVIPSTPSRPSPTARRSSTPPASPPAPAADPTPDAEALLRALGPALEARIDAAIAGVLHEQLPGLQSALQRAVAAVVHDAVAGARAQQGAPTDTGRYP